MLQRVECGCGECERVAVELAHEQAVSAQSALLEQYGIQQEYGGISMAARSRLQLARLQLATGSSVADSLLMN